MKKPFSWYLLKLDRLAAWTLLGSMFVYFVSGYGMTKGLIDANLATNLHTKYLPIVIILSFAFHTLYAVHLSFKRWRIWNGATRALLILAYGIFTAGLLYLDIFYSPFKNVGGSTNPGTASPPASVSTGDDSDEQPANLNQSVTTPPATNTQKTFNAAQLASFNGQNGSPAYVAVDGSVYDLSSVFTSGVHFSHVAGQDLTNAFYSRHAKSVLLRFPVVGTFQK